jgi:hypothetical protein
MTKRLDALRASEYRVEFTPADRSGVGRSKVAISSAPWDRPLTAAALREALDAYNTALEPGGVLEHLTFSHGKPPYASAGRIVRNADNRLICEVEAP